MLPFLMVPGQSLALVPWPSLDSGTTHYHVPTILGMDVLEYKGPHQRNSDKLSVRAYIFNPRTLEAKAGRARAVLGQIK